MKKIIFAVALLATLGSCGVVTYPGMVTENKVGEKRGFAQAKVVLGITFGHRDLGTIKAAKSAKITKVGSVDFRIKKGLFVTTYTTIVTGEGDGSVEEDK